MAERNVTDATGRTWLCRASAAVAKGRDVVLSCTTTSLKEPVSITVGWNWETMAANGLARMISQAAPAR